MKLTVQAPIAKMKAFRAMFTQGACDELQKSMPIYARKFMTVDRLTRIAQNCFAKTPALWDCSPRAIFRCLQECALLGLEPSAGGSMPQAYLIPFKEECSLVVAWQGWIALARRTGCVEQISARNVFEKDEFNYGHDLDGLRFVHNPSLGEDRGKLVGSYCIWKCEGVWEIHYMSRADLEARKKASPAGERGPWGTWFPEMCLKTVVKSAAKWWPKPNMDAADAMEKADTFDAEQSEHRIIDMPPLGQGQEEKQSTSDRLADEMAANVVRKRPKAEAVKPAAAREAPAAETTPPKPIEQAQDDAYDYGEPDPDWDK